MATGDYNNALIEQDLLYNIFPFECVMCLMDANPGEGVVLECFHAFCKECLKTHIEFSDKPEIKCPDDDGRNPCGTVIRDFEIRELVDEVEYNKYVQRSLRFAIMQMGNTFACQTPGCNGLCVYDLKAGDKEFPCYLCMAKNCLLCKAIHTGKTCAEYKEDYGQAPEIVLANEMIRAGKAMRCPTCNNVIEKVEGCDWINCVCKTELCWATKGPRWGPKGKYDTSGGCRCRINNIMCAPNCRNCH